MNKEEIYDAQIAPLMAQIIGICQDSKIAMVASFAIPNETDDDLCCSSSLPDETGELPQHLKVMREVIDRHRGATTQNLMMTLTHADGTKTMVAVIP